MAFISMGERLGVTASLSWFIRGKSCGKSCGSLLTEEPDSHCLIQSLSPCDFDYLLAPTRKGKAIVAF